MPTLNNVRVLGIDPGYGRLGFAVLDRRDRRETLITAGCIETSPQESYEKRLNIIGRALEKMVLDFKPTAFAIEKLFLSVNQKTAMRVAETRGIALYLASHLPIYEFSPPEIKLTVCGYGRADKKQVENVIRMIFKPEKNLNDDALDAIAIAFTALGRIR